MSLQNDGDLIGTVGDWVHIVHPETGGTHTATREAWETIYKGQGWELLLDPADPDSVVPSEEVAESTTSDTGTESDL